MPTFDTDDIPNIHPLAANTARMFTAQFVRRHPISEDIAQDFANELGFALHLLFTEIESSLDVISANTAEQPYGEMIETLIAGIKQFIRTGINVGWDDDEDGDEKVRIGPKVLA